MALKDQIHIYSVDTTAFYTDEEQSINIEMGTLKSELFGYKEFIKKTKKRRIQFERKKKKNINYSYEDEYKSKLKRLKNEKSINSLKFITEAEEIYNDFSERITELNKEIKILKNKLKSYITVTNDKGIIRDMRDGNIIDKNIIAVFDSSLTRTLELEPRLEPHLDIIIVQVYYFDILDSIVSNGFTINGEKYSYYGSSNGQIKSKKAVFLKENKWMRYEGDTEVWSSYGKTLMCGLTFAEINSKGGDKGINPNKFNSYLSLNNSATDSFTDFSIDSVIVVDDFETFVNGNVDYIHTDTFEIERNKNMDVPINQMDGCGIMLPSAYDKAFMVRAAFVKGLLVPFDFLTFIEEKGGNPIIKDIYGKKWDVVKDNIKCIMTKSQFKLWKYYDSWDDYKTRFKENNCELCYANKEEDWIKNSKINYQMLQSLSDITDDEVDYITKKSVEKIKKISKDKETIFNILGITDNNLNKTYLQQSIELYSPLLSDGYTRKVIRDIKNKLVTDAKSGKVEIGGKYVFMIPDLYAFCEHIFLGIEKPVGLLNDGEISCNIYSKSSEVACLRAPHLYREWGIRKNINNLQTKKWFLSNGLYMSSDDLLSKLVMNDWDSDKSLVISDSKIISIAKRHMKDIRPVYYEMAIATASVLNMKTRYKGLIDAYKGGGIGMFSNQITKIWNNASGKINLDLIRYLVMVNNFQIDFSKTLYKINIPKDIKKKISEETKSKVPHFFMYVKKDKTKDQVEPINNSTVNKICNKIPNVNLTFKNTEFGEFNYNMLMNDFNFENSCFIKEVIDFYTKRVEYLPDEINYDEIKDYKGTAVFNFIRNDFEEKFIDYNFKNVVDSLIYYLYHIKKTERKQVLWDSFGDILVENLNQNLKKYRTCEKCGKLIEKKSNKTKYCQKCGKQEHKRVKLEAWHRNKLKY